MDEFSSPPSKRYKLLRIVGTLITGSLLVYLFKEQGWNEILAGLRLMSAWLLLSTLVLTIISRLAVATRWHVLLISAGLPISRLSSVRITFAGLFATNFLPTTIGGDVVRLAGAVMLRFDAAISAASLVVDRMVGVAGMAMVLPLCIPGLREFSQTSWHTPIQIILLSTAPVKSVWKSVADKSRAAISKIRTALGLWLRNPRSLVVSLAWSWLHMLCLFAIIWLLFFGLGESISFWLVAGLYSLVYFFTLIPISINGYGLQEVSLTFIFYQLGGLSLSSCLTVALLFRTLIVIGSLPGAFFIPDILSRRNPVSG